MFTIQEHGRLCKHPDGAEYGYTVLTEEQFDPLERWVLKEALDVAGLSSRRGIGKVITAKNYVGVLMLQDGTQIEILPKLYGQSVTASETVVKDIFLQMLQMVRDIPSKRFSSTGLDSRKFPILELFMRMFIDEAALLVKRGLKSDYRQHQSNEHYYKGKLDVSQQIKHNVAYRERFFIAYDELTIDRPENRLIKATIERLRKIATNAEVQKKLSVLLEAFDLIDTPVDLDLDWERVSLDRGMQEYEPILSWCRLFLSDRSFTPFKGGGVAYALLFPMEKLYERYMARLLQKNLAGLDIRIRLQDGKHHLFQSPAKFQLRPDIVLEGRSGTVIVDTKWKLLSVGGNYGIAQSDMYQAYAYAKKYDARQVVLLYPWVPNVQDAREPLVYESGDGVVVRVELVNLTMGSRCTDELARELREIVSQSNANQDIIFL
ncbi:McrC family protein [Paenibacillus sp. FSL W8-1187]|uniref:McrBC 5-methylcytosine restriction system component n=1 Tax=Paenibacillus pasadenensis TaxID=217090 RepID=A0A2N5N0T1_9BACL|nr:McrC family protein [Paenibacillus pasadenensis]PLT43940.1 McrBC 5-methylcytosine restriction system component [Paenibacillus pasadenensis]